MPEALFNKRYRLNQELGRGAMGTIYQAKDTVLDRQVALKMITASQLTEENRVRLLSEARAAAKLNHPNIVAIYDAGEEDHTPFIVMELVEGGSLYEKKPESLEETLVICRQICAALEHAHQHGIVHRDLKPENVLRSGNNLVKLNDFGMAHSLTDRNSSENILLGTVYYIAPETIQGKPVDGRADLYALGVMLYEWITGRVPFTAEDPVAVISQHLYAPVVPPHAYVPQIAPELENLILSLLCKNPEDRPQSASEVGMILKSISAGQMSELPIQPTYLLDRIVRGKLVGREKELGQGRAVWQQVLTGSSQIFVVSGEPGIGKTRFVRELIANATLTGGRCLVGECFSEGGAPYQPLAPMIRESLGEKSKNKVDLPGYVLSDLIKITPGLEGLQDGFTFRQSLDAGTEQQHIFESVFAWVDALARQSPLLLFFDDIHWADSASLLLIHHLAHRLEHQRVMMVLAYREIELRDDDLANHILHELLRGHLATRVKLTRFDANQTGEMIATMLNPQGPVDPDLVEAIYHETEGNPFFVEEVCKALIEEGFLCYQNSRWESPGVQEISIPQSVRLTVQSRLTRLSNDAQDLLRLAAVIGREFEFDILVRASEMSEERIVECLEAAEKAQIIRETKKGGSEQVTFAFEHALIPATLREEISGLRRGRYHRRVAEAVEAIHPEDYETLSYHYEECGDAEKAFENYRKAGSRALSIYANQEALQYFEKALELCSDKTCQAELNSGIAEAAFRLGNREVAERAFLKAIEIYRITGDLENMAFLYTGAARAVWYMGEGKLGLDLCRMGMKELPEGLESRGMATLIHETARACRFNYLYEEALELVRKAISLAKKLDLQEVLADCYATLGIVRIIPYEEATAALEEAVSIAEKNGFTTILARARLNLGTHFLYDGKNAQAYEQYSQMLELTTRTGLSHMEFMALSSIMDIEVALSRFSDAESRLQKLLELQPINPNPTSAMITIQNFRIIFHWIKGNFKEALQLIDQNMGPIQNDKLKEYQFWLLIMKGKLLGETGETGETKKVLDEILASQPEDKDENPGNLNSSILQLFFQLKDKDGVLEQAEILKNLVGARPTATQKAFLLIAEARSAWLVEDYELAWKKYQELLEALIPLGDLWRLGLFHEEISDFLQARNSAGDRKLAAKHLKSAQEQYRLAEMRFFAERAGRKIETLSTVAAYTG